MHQPTHSYNWILLGSFALMALPTSLFAQSATPTNLQVLPADISQQELSAAMFENLSGLGLPRRQNEGCLYCHEGNMEVPANQWDWASDSKLTKRKAREMMAMVHEINARLEQLEGRIAPELKVSCHTCHAGRTDPRPLESVLLSAYDTGGIESTITRYRVLRERYFGADAYDFRFNTLAVIAQNIASRGFFNDAVAISRLNEEMFADSTTARTFTVTLRIRQELRIQGLEAGFALFDEFVSSEASDVMNVSILDNLGWGFFRAERQDDALQIFRKNLEMFPDEYVPNESVGDALWISGSLDEGIAVFEAWLNRHPDHAMARRRLATLQSR